MNDEDDEYNQVFQWLLNKGLPMATVIIFAFGFVMWAIVMVLLYIFLKKYH